MLEDSPDESFGVALAGGELEDSELEDSELESGLVFLAALLDEPDADPDA